MQIGGLKSRVAQMKYKDNSNEEIGSKEQLYKYKKTFFQKFRKKAEKYHRKFLLWNQRCQLSLCEVPFKYEDIFLLSYFIFVLF